MGQAVLSLLPSNTNSSVCVGCSVQSHTSVMEVMVCGVCLCATCLCATVHLAEVASTRLVPASPATCIILL